MSHNDECSEDQDNGGNVDFSWGFRKARTILGTGLEATHATFW